MQKQAESMNTLARLDYAPDLGVFAAYGKEDRNLIYPSGTGKQTTYKLGIQIRVPIWSGLSNHNNLEAANQGIFRAFGKEIGLPDRAIDQTFKQLKRQVKKAASIIRPPDAEPPDGFVHRFKEIVDNSCLRILET